MSKKLILEMVVSALIVLIPTFFIYRSLAEIKSFWNAQSLWSIGLAICWVIVAAGYYHQGWLVHTRRKADGVSIILPTAVFFVQCILFVKGIYYKDWSLVWGAIVVNSGVVFSFIQIVKARREFFKTASR